LLDNSPDELYLNSLAFADHAASSVLLIDRPVSFGVLSRFPLKMLNDFNVTVLLTRLFQMLIVFFREEMMADSIKTLFFVS